MREIAGATCIVIKLGSAIIDRRIDPSQQSSEAEGNISTRVFNFIRRNVWTVSRDRRWSSIAIMNASFCWRVIERVRSVPNLYTSHGTVPRSDSLVACYGHTNVHEVSGSNECDATMCACTRHKVESYANMLKAYPERSRSFNALLNRVLRAPTDRFTCAALSPRSASLLCPSLRLSSTPCS